uniref:non-specific serine/threonine protein kinase n=1 Tax=Xiphophorus maculatus TaxID=8083 RepID=A0A3B5PSB1_XIPMA
TTSAHECSSPPGEPGSGRAEEMASSFLSTAELVKQGAEARLYRAAFLGKPTIIKERFPKLYRHPELHDKLNSRRTAHEVRSILRCRKAGFLPRLPCIWLNPSYNLSCP